MFGGGSVCRLKIVGILLGFVKIPMRVKEALEGTISWLTLTKLACL